MAKECPFFFPLLLTLSGSTLSLLLVILTYDTFHDRRRRLLWRPLRKVVAAAVGRQLGLFAQSLSWRLHDRYVSYGAQVRHVAVLPTAAGAAATVETFARILEHLAAFDGDYLARVRHNPDDSKAEQSGTDLATIFRQELGPDKLRALRDALTPLHAFAEESAEVIIATEDLIAAAWLADLLADASLRGETGEADFMASFPEVVLKMKSLYAIVAGWYDEAT